MPKIIVGRLLMGPAVFDPLPLLGEIGPRAMGVAVDAVLLQGMRGVEDSLDRFQPVLLFALRHIIAGEAEIIEDPALIGPLPEQVVVLEEMVVADRGMR